jgi:hypothetical protein
LPWFESIPPFNARVRGRHLLWAQSLRGDKKLMNQKNNINEIFLIIKINTQNLWYTKWWKFK